MAVLVAKKRGVFSVLPGCNRGGRAANFFLACFLFWACFEFPANEVSAQSVSREYPLKAVFLLNFARFTDWPTNSFAGPDAPFIVGVLGKNPFGPLIEQTDQGEAIDRHKIQVEYYRNVADLKECNMLFISQSEAGRVSEVVAKLKTKPVLSVADFPDAAGDGVCVQFVTEHNRIRFRINTNALKAAHLMMSSELLRLAEIVSR